MPNYAPPLFTHFDANNGAISLVRNQPNKIGLGDLKAYPASVAVPNGTTLRFQNDTKTAQDLVFAGVGGYSTVSALAPGQFTDLTLTTAGLTTFTFGSITGNIQVSDGNVGPNVPGLYTATYGEPYNQVFDDHKSFESQD